MRILLALSALALCCASTSAEHKTTLKLIFKYEGRTYVIDRLAAHQAGAMPTVFTPTPDGGWYLEETAPELGRRKRIP